jgi:ABC-type transport system involved in multi-copper enzyme maturation permease subunit
MIKPFQSRFFTIFQNEVRLNSKRVAPYAMIVLFIGAAVLGWGRGPAVALGWATNSDFYIARGLKAFSFLFGLPIFNAVIMGDAMIRDFRFGIDPLIFSKPLNRAQYLFGKFFGNFFVLLCCMAAFPLTLLALQAFHPAQMVVQPVKVLPYFKHFFFFVVITQFTLAAFYFMAGSLTRSSKIVYGLAVSFYPLFISAMLFLPGIMTVRGRNFLDVFLLNSGPSRNGFGNSADHLNQYVYSYTPDMIANRTLLVFAGLLCLTVLYFRFRTTASARKPPEFSMLALSAEQPVAYEGESLGDTGSSLRLPVTVANPNSGNRGALNSLRSFGAIFCNEVRLNSRRVAPYLLMLFSVFNAVLWSVGLGATYYGKEVLAKYGRLWATNSDYYITHNFSGYALGIFGLPIFAAVIMAEPVRRDFRLEIDALIFSKPVSRAHYLLGKFFGSFFVLVCCQASFAATLVLIQVLHPSQTVVLPFRLLPYFKHFIMIVVITYLLFAAVYFTIGTLTRNPKIVYVLAIASYPLMAFYGIFFLKNLPRRWGALLNPLMTKEVEIQTWGRSPEWVDQLVISYTPIMFANRALVIIAAAVCLTIVCRRFRIAEPSGRPENSSWLNLSADSEVVYCDPPILQPTHGRTAIEIESVRVGKAEAKETAVPSVILANAGLRANLAKLAAALGVEFRLLGAERSLVVVMPLAIFVSTLEVAFYNIHADVSLSAAYATNTANLLLLFLIAIAVFYTGEAMHRDREMRIEPVLWAAPVTNNALLLSKFLATFLLLLGLLAAVGIAGIGIQILRGHTPIDLLAYFRVYGVILLPGIIFLPAVSVLLNVALRNKYLVYVLSIGIAAGLLYLYNLGYNHWLYNPVLYRLWSYGDLMQAATLRAIVWRRAYWLGAAILSLALAHLFFPRKSNRRTSGGHQLSTPQG